MGYGLEMRDYRDYTECRIANSYNGDPPPEGPMLSEELKGMIKVLQKAATDTSAVRKAREIEQRLISRKSDLADGK